MNFDVPLTMKIFKYLPPYKPNGKTNFPESQQRSGVYLIKENGKLVYIGYSTTDLYKTLYRHFQQWTDQEYKGNRVISVRDRITYYSKLKRNTYTVRIVYCTPIQADKLEKMLILKYNPRDNTHKYENLMFTDGHFTVEEEYFTAPLERESPF